jgi:putative flippase GtrA
MGLAVDHQVWDGGAVGTGGHYATLIVLVEFIGVGPVAATTAGFLVGMLVNYALNHRYTFRSDRPHGETAPRFVFIAICTGVLNAFLVHLGVDVARINYLLVQVIATGTTFLLNFLLNSVWTFAGPQNNEQ